jgi:hypothetical protein
MPDRFGIDLIHVLPRGVAIFIAEESDDGTANVALALRRAAPSPHERMTLPPRQTTTPRNPGTLRAASSAIRAARDDKPIGGNIAGCAELTDHGPRHRR